jgi:hypothetical protein
MEQRPMPTSPARRQPRGCIPRALGLYALFLLLALGPWLIGGNVFALWRVRQESKAWTEAGLGFEAFRARHPVVGDSPAAVELDRRARVLGIALIRRAGEESQVADRQPYELARQYVGRLCAASDNAAFEPPPAEVRRVLGRHRASLEAVADQLLGADEIAWEMDIEAGPASPVPSLLAQRYLHLLLLLEAVERTARDDPEGALRFLEAARRLTDALAARPDTLSQLIAIALASDEAGLLRTAPALAPGWATRLRESRFFGARLVMLQAEAYSWLTLTRGLRGVADLDARPERGFFTGKPAAWIVRGFSIPFMRLSMTSISRHLRRLGALLQTEEPCTLSAPEVERKLLAGISRWDVIAKLAVPGLARAWVAALEGDLQAERTAVVLEAYQRLRQSGDWGPAQGQPSGHCPHLRWVLRPQRDGSLTIDLEPAPTLNPDQPRQWTFTLARQRGRR